MSKVVVTYDMMVNGGYRAWLKRFNEQIQKHTGQDTANKLTKREEARMRAIEKKLNSLRKEINVLLGERFILEKKIDFKCGHPLEKIKIEQWTGHDTLGNFNNSSEMTLKCGGCNKELDQWTEW
jgi:hypothetical protein